MCAPSRYVISTRRSHWLWQTSLEQEIVLLLLDGGMRSRPSHESDGFL